MTNYVVDHDRIIEIPLGISAWDIADRFADAQSSSTKAAQVRRNTLAVLAVRDYLTWHEIETNIAASDCWNPAVRMMEDVADLVLPNLGRVECRPVAPGEATCELPMETLMERMGYFWVELDLDASVARLVGFAEPTFEEDVLSVTLQREQLASLDQFHAFLGRREKIAALINSAYANLLPHASERPAIETEWTWITLRFPNYQWKLRAKQSLEKYQEFESTPEAVLGLDREGAASGDAESWDDRLQDFFDDLADDLDLE
ncbi:MAG: DUF1822 family protein [Synechococcales bacterium]|nr:DUF1822 family protein [Synechococcales bacterium]